VRNEDTRLVTSAATPELACHRVDAMNSLKDKIAIITGAVGNLGTATARAFQQAGAKTVLVIDLPTA
jgi:threonine dehydrogenase-like Zn-dependent dehydrogenase